MGGQEAARRVAVSLGLLERRHLCPSDCGLLQVLHLLGPKTEADLEKKPKVGLSMVLGPWG